MQLVITVNGPGEVSGWLTPLTTELRARYPDLSIFVFLLPCVFASGREAEVIMGLGTVDGVATVRQTWRYVLTGRLPEGLHVGVPSLVFHLGGEVPLSRIIAWRLDAKVQAYREGFLPLKGRVEKVFYTGLLHQPDDPSLIVGEMMVDAAEMRRKAAPARDPARKLAALFPGSRDYLAAPLLPYYAAIVDRLAPRHPQVDWVIARSDYLTLEFLRNLPQPPDDAPWPFSRLTFHQEGARLWFVTQGGTRIDIAPGREVVALADVALTIPGTNTGEIAAFGTPMVVAIPTYREDIVPMPGIFGHIARIPWIGPALRRQGIKAIVAHARHLALPNRRAGRRIVPEFMGRGIDGQITEALDGFLGGDTTALRQEIRATMGKAGAAQRLAQEIGTALGMRGAG